MKRIGITGQSGFVGSYLFDTLSLLKEEFTVVPFQKEFFDDPRTLEAWVADCDVIVHLAAMNRHPDQQVIHDTNILLVRKLINALETAGNNPQILFSSSTQEERDNPYGNSKKKGRELLKVWAEEKKAVLTGMIIPNVFGPFGKPFYNSVVATFCYQLCHGQQPAIDVDGHLKLIYVDELAKEIVEAIRKGKNDPQLQIPHTSEHSVSQLLEHLNRFKEQYLENGVFPQLQSTFERNLFNTFRSFIDYKNYFPRKFTTYADDRGVFVELARLYQYGQVSFSTTYPGITRGNHFHTRKIERFAVIKGKARIQLRKYGTTEVLDFELDGQQPAYVDMPIWYTHNITNIGSEELYTIFWINEFYDPADPDTYFETV